MAHLTHIKMTRHEARDICANSNLKMQVRHMRDKGTWVLMAGVACGNGTLRPEVNAHGR